MPELGVTLGIPTPAAASTLPWLRKAVVVVTAGPAGPLALWHEFWGTRVENQLMTSGNRVLSPQVSAGLCVGLGNKGSEGPTWSHLLLGALWVPAG